MILSKLSRYVPWKPDEDRMSDLSPLNISYGIKKNKIMPFAVTCMALEIVILSEVRQRKTNIIR